jgi:glutathione S-transferase
MAIVFYYAPMSSATRVHWALEEVGVPYEKVRLDLRAGDTRKPDFLRINPNGKVPTLVDDGVIVFESLAIFLHLGERYGVAKKLWPEAGTPARAESLSWIVWGTVTLGAQVSGLFYLASDRVPVEQRDPVKIEAARKELDKTLGILDGRLNGREWMVGDGFTFVDLAIAATVSFATRVNVDLASHTNVKAWLARCTQRPGLAVAAAG